MAPGAAQRDQRRLLGVGCADRCRAPEGDLHLSLRHLSCGGLDRPRAGVPVRPAHHPAGLGVDRPTARDQALAARQTLSVEPPTLLCIADSARVAPAVRMNNPDSARVTPAVRNQATKRPSPARNMRRIAETARL